MDDCYRTLLRQHPPRRVHDRRGGDRRVRGGARARSPASSTRRDDRGDRVHRATRPRRSTSSRTRGPAQNLREGDVDRAHATWSTTPTSCRGTCSPPSAASSCAGSRSPTTSGSTSRDLDELLDGAKLLAISAMSNVLGTINDIRPLADAAHAAGALVLVDACQSVPHVATDVQAWDADFVAFSGHKMLGPSGIGALWARRELLEAMPPFLGGGEMIRDVRLDGFTTNDVPWKFEAGHAADRRGRSGFGAAVDYLEALGMDAVRAHEMRAHPVRARRAARPLRRRAHDLRPARRRGPRRRGLVPVRRHPRPRHQPGARRGRGVRAGRAPLRQAADAPARRAGDDAGRRSTSTTTKPTSTRSSRRWPRPRSSSPSDAT